MMESYSVKQLAKLAGVSVRTLHLYDEIGLLKPGNRTGAGYRKYGEKELLRLQQILFYKEMDIPLSEIAGILDDPDFDLLKALGEHKAVLLNKQSRITSMLHTIDKTILKLKKKTKMKHEELYEGLPKEQAESYRKEAIDKYGEETIKRSENFLKSLGKEGFEKLKKESEQIRNRLVELMNEDPQSKIVQEQITLHYNSIRMFWGTINSPDKQAEAYVGLGQLYVNDERFTMINGKPNPQYALFMSKAMAYYAKTKLS